MADVAYQEQYVMNAVEARKRLILTYGETGSLRATARRWHTSRHVVRKWLRCLAQEGEAGLCDRSRRPHHSCNQTSEELEGLVLQARVATEYGRERLALCLERQGILLSPSAIRNILRRHGVARSKRQRRKALYPARWAWDEEVPFSLIQADVKDILDKKALGTALWQHIRRQRLPRYQWTACDGRSRLRFLAYSHRTDDEEFYRPYLMQTTCDQHLVDLAARWLYFYNVLSPHLGKQMAKSTRLQVLHRLGYSGHDRIALLPPILLGSISTDLLLSCDPEGGNDLLAITGYLVMRGAASEASPHASPYGSANAQWAGPDPGRTPLSPTAATLGSEALR